MVDDDRPDPRDRDLARRLAVEPLDELTRRRLVGTALRETAPAGRSSRSRRWLVAAAIAMLVGVGGVALLTAQGGHDEPTAFQDRGASTSGAAAPAAPTPASVGDFGDLDQRANLDALRDRLAADVARKGAAESQSSDLAAGAAGEPFAASGATCPFTPPSAATIVGAGTGTIDGRRTTVYLVERADGTRTYEAVLEAPCEARRLR